MKTFKDAAVRTYVLLTGNWRMTLGVPFLALSILVTAIYMGTTHFHEGVPHFHGDILLIVALVWWAGFFSRGIADFLVERVDGVVRDVWVLSELDEDL